MAEKVKAVWFQGPSSGISDSKAFKKALTKRYSEARKKHGNVQVLYRGSKSSQADQFIGEWASEGYTKYLPPSTNPKKLQTVSRGHLFRTNKKGLPIKEKESIKINRIQVPKGASKDFVDKQLDKWQENKQLIDRASFSRKGDVVYPGKDTKKHFERFEELIKAPKQGGLGLNKGFEAYLDELEDIGKGSTKQAPDTIRTLSIKGKKVTRLPIIGEGQGQVTKVETNIKLLAKAKNKQTAVAK